MGLSIRAYAQHRGVSHTAVAKAIKAGRINKEPDGTIDPVKADAAWERNTHPAQQATVVKPVATPRGNPAVSTVPPTVRKPESGSSPATAPDYQTSRAIREAYAARLAKLEFEERTGKLVNADEAKVTTFNLARRLRDRLLTLPRRLSAAFAAESDSRAIEQQLENEIRQALEELSHEP